MAFIAINARADVEGSKKGKLTPAQNAQVNAWTLSQKTGVFNVLQRCQATLTNQGDYFNLEFRSGYLAICGRIVECEAGTNITVQKPPVGQTARGYIVARYNLQATGDSEFEVVAITTTPVTNDLNDMPTAGVYEFVLYEYNVDMNGTATIIRPTGFRYIQSNEYALTKIITDLTNGTTKVANAVTSDIALYASEDTSKGTIEQRLTALGFKEGSVSGLAGATLTKMGKYAILQIPEINNKNINIEMQMSFTIAEPLTLRVYGDIGYATLQISGQTITYNGAYGANMPKLQIGFIISEW